jgi:hypothetical protein
MSLATLVPEDLPEEFGEEPVSLLHPAATKNH